MGLQHSKQRFDDGDAVDVVSQAASVVETADSRFSPIMADMEWIYRPEPQTIKLPFDLGPFRLEAPLGKGGFGEVYRACRRDDADAGIDVAVKVCLRDDDLFDDKRRSKTLRSEADVLARIEHDNVVRIIDRGETDEWTWVAMEFVDGYDLDDEFKRLRRRVGGKRSGPSSSASSAPSSREELHRHVRWFRDLATALDAMHAEKFVHRDVKPSNIRIDKNGKPYLLDLGLAADVGSPEKLRGELAGSFQYMSPEQTQGGFANLGGRSDIYSLAACFFELLTGRKLVRTEAKGERESLDLTPVLQAVAFDAIPRISSVGRTVPSTLDPIFAKALAKKSDERYDEAAHLVEDIDLWFDGQPPRHAKEGVRAKTRRLVGKYPVATAALITVMLGVAVGFGISAYKEKRAFNAALAEIDDASTRASEDRSLFARIASATRRFGKRPELETRCARATLDFSNDIMDDMIRHGAFTTRRRVDRLLPRGVTIDDLEECYDFFPSEGFLTAIVFYHVMNERKVDALARLRSSKRRTGLVTELEAIVYIALDDHLATAETLKKIDPEETNHNVTCLRALRQLWLIENRLGLRKNDRERWPPVPEYELTATRTQLNAILARDDNHRFARTLRSMLSFRLEDSDAAVADAERLVELAENDEDRSAARARLAEYVVGMAHRGEGDWDILWDRAWQLAVSAIEVDAAFLSDLSWRLTRFRGFRKGFEPCDEIARDIEEEIRAWRVSDEWCRRVMAWSSRPIVDSRFVLALNVACKGASEEDLLDRVDEICLTFEDQEESTIHHEVTPRRRQYLLTWAWAVFELADADWEETAARKLVVDRYRSGLFMRVGAAFPGYYDVYEGRCFRAMVSGLVSYFDDDVKGLRDAVSDLRGLVRRETLERELIGKSGGYRRSLERTWQRCRSVLERLNEAK